MSKSLYRLLLTLLLVVTAAGCGTVGSDAADELDGLFEERSDLDERLDSTATDSSATSGKTMAFSMRQVASLAAPTVEGTPTAASYLAFSGDNVYVGYITAGEPFSGGVDVLDAEDPLDPSRSSTYVSRYMDVGALAKDGNDLYIAGAIAPEAALEGLDLSSPAVLLKTDARNLAAVEGLYDLPSSAATDVAYRSSNVYTTSGSVGGGLYTLDKRLRLDAEESAEDLRSVVVTSDYVYALSGDGTVYRRDRNRGTLQPFASVPVGIGVATVAKMSFARDRLYVPLNQGGFIVLDGETGETITTFTGATVNGVYATGSYVYVAATEGGVIALRWTADTLEELGRVDLDGTQANVLIADEEYLYVASGLGGVRILALDGVEDDDDDDDDDD